MRSKTLRPALLSTVLGLGLGLTVGACNPYDPDYGEIPVQVRAQRRLPRRLYVQR
jgi:hypothetical protein